MRECCPNRGLSPMALESEHLVPEGLYEIPGVSTRGIIAMARWELSRCDNSPASRRAARLKASRLNPKGIPPQSPGLLGTSYPG